MPNNLTTVPQVEFHGTGMRVNGAEVSGDVILAWLTHSADRGYVLKCDDAIGPALDRTDSQKRGNLAGIFESIGIINEMASGL